MQENVANIDNCMNVSKQS